MGKEALFYKKVDDNNVQCYLCHHNCKVSKGNFGLCGVRENREGILYSNNYGKLVATHIDPIEKKPFFHFFPGELAYSIAAIGCNFKCDFCQNWQISQHQESQKLGVESENFSCEEIVKKAIESGCKIIAYTYTEPTVFFEFAYDCAKIAKKEGLYNTFVTNGYMSRSALEFIAPYLDAANVDLKSFREAFYKKFCRARLAPVLENIKLMKKLNIWVEITTLIIPQENDSLDELSDIIDFIISVDKNIPWHISRFHPDYKLYGYLPTEIETLQKVYQLAKSKGLRYVYIGNAYTDYAENTYCYQCSRLLIKRVGFSVVRSNLREGKCNFCGAPISGRGLGDE